MSEKSDTGLDPASADFYKSTLLVLSSARFDFVVGGAYAYALYTGIERHTKDFDLFVRRSDLEGILRALADAGYRTEFTFPHWLAKAYRSDDFIDLIFASGNGVSHVDDTWFEHAREGGIFGVKVKLCPPEEMIWTKALVMERERYDGADVAHLLLALGRELDWQRLIARFDENWPVLLSHLILFRYIYPGEQDRVPGWVLGELTGRFSAGAEGANLPPNLCRGTILSREQYLHDTQKQGYLDGRKQPFGNLTASEIEEWTAAIGKEK